MDQQEAQFLVRHFDMAAQYLPGAIDGDHAGLPLDPGFERFVTIDVETEHVAPSRVSEIFTLSLEKPRFWAKWDRILIEMFLLGPSHWRILMIFWGIASVLRVAPRASGTR